MTLLRSNPRSRKRLSSVRAGAARWLWVAAAAFGCLGLVAARGAPPRFEEIGRTQGVAILQLRLPWSNLYLIESSRLVLVDAGSSGDLDSLEQALAARGHSLHSIAYVLVTHAHADHAGLAANLKEQGTKVVLGAPDRAMARAGENQMLAPTRFFSRVLALFVPHKFPGFDPDVTIDAPTSLEPFGLSGIIEPAPGHTSGTLVVRLDDGQAFVGDLILGGAMGGALFPHSPGEHYFHDDRGANVAQTRRLLGLGVERFFLGHGGPVEAPDVATAFGASYRK